ncbi:hypothetical protein ACTD5D_12705 [Nocardia takedensis]|uniref:hypothetical protein n=1 Tax=Nocardia takedensis TaxID=259390 RepID=UPI00030FA603|nr:hypothetical protein [Nocardia takedensis]
MDIRGISYDTGFLRAGNYSRPDPDPDIVRREMRVIRDDLHCTAVRVMGGDPERLDTAASIAAELGLAVWYSPYPLDLAPEAILTLFADCAERAERLRAAGAEIVFVTGAELSLMNLGFLPGGTFAERMALLRRPDGLREHLGDAAVRVNEFLTAAVDLVRARFHGPLTYAAIHWENVDWSRFEMISMDLYRSAEVADRFADGVRALVALGKPVAVTEFGASSFAGAAERGATGLDIVEYDDRGTPQRLDARYDRDEAAQAEYLRDLLTVFENEGVHAAFVFTFALYDHVHRPDGDPRADLDLASYGIVKVYEDRRGATYPEMAWEPKAAFHAVAEHYRRGVA